MPNSIERDVYVLRDTLKNPISYVRGTDLLPIILHFRDFMIPSGATAKVFVAKNDGNAVYGSATISGNDVTVDVSQQMFITLGINLMQVEIDSGDETLVTFEQPVMVTPNLKAGDFPESTTDVDFIDKIIEQAQEAVDDANQALADANTAISGANTAASSANQAAQNANQAAEDLQDKVDAGDFTASVQVGTTTTLNPGQDATVSNGGTNKDAVLNFGIPKGDPGTAATIQVGTTQTVQPEENAEVTNTGTASAAVLNFKIPRGADGMTDLVAEYTDASEYTCQPTVNAPVVVKQVDGKTEQVVTTGAQLFDAENATWYTNSSSAEFKKTDTGVKFTAIKAIENTGVYALLANFDSSKTYQVSMDITVNNKNFSYIEIGIVGDSGNTLNVNSSEITTNTPYHINLPISNAIESGSGFFVIYINNAGYSAGTVLTAENIMVSESQEELPWEPYTGGKPSPSPEYPQAIKGTGGTGYFDGVWRQGSYDISGVPDTRGAWISFANKIPCKANDNIKASYDKAVVGIRIFFWNASGGFLSYESINGKETTGWTAPATAGSFVISFNDNNISPSTAAYCTVTINGEYATAVETQGRNLAEVTHTNKNLTNNGVTLNLNDNGSYTLNGTCTGGDAVFLLNQPIGSVSDFPTIFKFKSGIKYRVKDCQLFLRNSANPNGFTTESTNGMANDVFYTPTEDTEVIGIRALIRHGTTYSSTKTYYPGIWEDPDKTRTEWVPFKRTSITIPLTSPLYEGDKICYVKPGESYVNAEGETVTTGSVLYGCYRENAEVVLDGSNDENWNKSAGDLNQNDRFYIIVSKAPYITDLNKSNMLVWKTYATEDNSFYIDNNKALFIRILNITDVNALKTWLSTNPLTVVYRLAQPYFEPFADQSIFYDLRTDDTLTYIYSSDPINPNITVDVAKNSTGGILLESYATAQKNALAEADNASRLAEVEQQLLTLNTTVSTMGGAVSDLQTNTYALKGGIEIPENADLNNYRTPGNYYCPRYSTVQTLDNCPFTSAFTLKVTYGTGTGYPMQTFTEYNTDNIAIRFYNQELPTKTWSEYKYLTPTTQS